MVDGIIAFALVKALAKNLKLDLRKSTIQKYLNKP
jgi:niacin transporter